MDVHPKKPTLRGPKDAARSNRAAKPSSRSAPVTSYTGDGHAHWHGAGRDHLMRPHLHHPRPNHMG